MNTHESLALHGIEGLLTYNFFCESLITALHTAVHAMEDEGMDITKETTPIVENLADLGATMSKWYENQEIPLSVFKDKFFHLMKMSFDLDKVLSPLLQGHEMAFYYYSIFFQGMSLLANDVFERMHYDCAEDADAEATLDELYSQYVEWLHEE